MQAWTNAQMHEGHNTMTIARWLTASGAKNVIKQASGELNHIFQDEFNKILLQLSKNVSFLLSNTCN